MYGFDHTGMGLGAIGMVLVWLAPVALVLLWLLSRGRSGDTRTDRRTPLDILDERYARGEIGQDEYHSRRADLLNSDTNDGSRP
jgi:putative membrane protein